MAVTARILVLALLTGFGLSSPALAQAVEGEFTTAEGLTIRMAPITGMKCPEMDEMLAEIDRTGYRKNAPVPHHKADAPLHEYEIELAEENYHRCVLKDKKRIGGIRFIRRERSSQNGPPR